MKSIESRNCAYMREIFDNAVAKELSQLFIKEWNSCYAKTFGSWDNTIVSGQQLMNFESGSKHSKDVRSKFLNGNTEEWDCTALFSALIFSKSIGKTLNPTFQKAIDKLRVVRNKFVHTNFENFSDAEFQNMLNDGEDSFKDCRFSFVEINKIKTRRNTLTSFQILPPRPNHDVVQRNMLRDEIIHDLKSLRSTNNDDLTYFYISGNPGCGKSQLARQVCEEIFKAVDLANETSFVMTLDGKDVDTLLRSYVVFSRRISVDEQIIQNILKNNDETADKIKGIRSLLSVYLKTYQRWWLIVDNVVELVQISELLPYIGDSCYRQGQIIVTVQNKGAVPPDGKSTKHISISEGMSKDESRGLLSSLSNSDSANPLLGDVLQQLDRQPLALAAAAVYVRKVNEANRAFSWQKYLDKLAEGKRDLLDRHLREANPAYSATMFEAVRLAVKQNADKSRILKNTLYLFSKISFNPLPRDIIVQYIQQSPPEVDGEEIDVELNHCSLLLHSDEIDVRLHRIVHEAIQSFFSIDERDNSESVFKIATVFSCFDDQLKMIPHLCEFLTSSSQQLFQLLDTSKSEVDREIFRIYDYLVSKFMHFGKYKHAKNFLDLFSQVFQVDIWDSKHAMEKAWYCYWRAKLSYCDGHYDEAKLHFDKSIEIQTVLRNPELKFLAKTYHDLGLLYKKLGQYENAKNCYQLALEFSRKSLDPNHSEIAMVYNNLGSVLRIAGEYGKAEGCFKEALQLARQSTIVDESCVGTTYYRLGSHYSQIGKYKEAKEFLEQALKIMSQSFGREHLYVGITYDALGEVHISLGEFEKAEEFLTKALEIKRKSLRDDHIHVAVSFNNHGLLYRAMGIFEKAMEFHNKALLIRSKSLHPDHVDIAECHKNLGLVNYDMKKYEDANDLIRRA